jgi:hypothetical protein
MEKSSYDKCFKLIYIYIYIYQINIYIYIYIYMIRGSAWKRGFIYIPFKEVIANNQLREVSVKHCVNLDLFL